jgi:hypothetical protein
VRLAHHWTARWRGAWSRAPRRRRAASTSSAPCPRPGIPSPCSSRRSSGAHGCRTGDLSRRRERGACAAGYVLLRLPHELKELFRDWLKTHAPLQADHVMNRLRDCHGGKDYDARFGVRMRGTGLYADLLRKRFRLAHARLGFTAVPALDCTQFTPPADGQLRLF